MSKLNMDCTKVFNDIYSNYDFKDTEVKQGFVFEGGTRSSKSYSLIQFIIIYCATYENQNKRIRICRQKLTWLKMTLMLDFFEILYLYNLYNPANHNKTDNTYKLFGNTIFFLGLDEKQKLHGAQQHLFWFNEGMEASYDDFKQLNQRTTECFICDYNPSATSHWIYDHVITRPDTLFFHSTMLDNPFLPASIRRDILGYEPTPENVKNGTADELYWKIYGLGIRAMPQGVIFKDWNYVIKMPPMSERKITGYCLDYGFSNDPTAVAEICLAHGEIWIDEKIYETGLTNIINDRKRDQPSIEQRMIECNIRKGIDTIIAENAEPKSNRELQQVGFNIIPTKNKNIKTGIDILTRYRVNVTEKSINLKREVENYKWKWDKDNDKATNVPIDNWNHLIDAIRYWSLHYLIGVLRNRKRNINKAALGF